MPGPLESGPFFDLFFPNGEIQRGDGSGGVSRDVLFAYSIANSSQKSNQPLDLFQIQRALRIIISQFLRNMIRQDSSGLWGLLVPIMTWVTKKAILDVLVLEALAVIFENRLLFKAEDGWYYANPNALEHLVQQYPLLVVPEEK